MNDREIDALAKGMVPFVRDYVAPLAARLAKLEGRPVEKGEPGERGAEGPPGADGSAGIVPPALAEQIKAAIHLLHESPPIVQQNAPPRAASPLPPPRPSRIERNENGGFTLIYDEPSP